MGKSSPSIRYQERILRSFGGLELVPVELSHYSLGVDHWPAWQEAVEALPRDLEAIVTLANDVVQQGRLEEALALYRHLAGALGRPVWLLLPHIPEWRWGLEGATSHWYATMRVFRQPTPGDWSAVIREVREALITDVAEP